MDHYAVFSFLLLHLTFSVLLPFCAFVCEIGLFATGGFCEREKKKN
jgi:hypothetical protein